MRNFFERMAHRMTVFMYGRNGYDELNRFLTISALVCMVLSMILPIFNPIAMFLLIVSIFRTYSKNISARQKELQSYYKMRSKWQPFITRRKNMFRDRKTHKYYKCPNCKASLRVPKGKGKIEITCVKCRHKFRKKT